MRFEINWPKIEMTTFNQIKIWRLSLPSVQSHSPTYPPINSKTWARLNWMSNMAVTTSTWNMIGVYILIGTTIVITMNPALSVVKNQTNAQMKKNLQVNSITKEKIVMIMITTTKERMMKNGKMTNIITMVMKRRLIFMLMQQSRWMSE